MWHTFSMMEFTRAFFGIIFRTFYTSEMIFFGSGSTLVVNFKIQTRIWICIRNLFKHIRCPALSLYVLRGKILVFGSVSKSGPGFQFNTILYMQIISAPSGSGSGTTTSIWKACYSAPLVLLLLYALSAMICLRSGGKTGAKEKMMNMPKRCCGHWEHISHTLLHNSRMTSDTCYVLVSAFTDSMVYMYTVGKSSRDYHKDKRIAVSSANITGTFVDSISNCRRHPYMCVN